MNAVVFSFYNYLDRGYIYLDEVVNNYPNCDVYVGINPSVSFNINKLPLLNNIYYSVANTLNIVNSDVTGYQSALSMFKLQHKQYDLVHFLHCKGSSYNKQQQYEESKKNYFNGYLNLTQQIEEKMKNPNIGMFCNYGRLNLIPENIPIFERITTLYNNTFTHPRSGIDPLLSFYTIKGNLLLNFLDNCNPDIFSKNIVKDLGFDRYFFEDIFPLFVERMGYYMYVDKWWDFGGTKFSKKILNELIVKWSSGKFKIGDFHANIR